eukprot:SAG22_NODE_794_length_7157_cov_3.169453_5_plen_326_part_00
MAQCQARLACTLLLLLLLLLLTAARSAHGSTGDTLLDKYFCGIYYPTGAAAAKAGLPACEAVKAAVTSVLTTPLPTLSLGDPAKPALFFVHGWPDSAAEFAAQFGGLCYGPAARYRCVAATWQNFHPDLPDAPLEELKFETTIEKLAATMVAAKLVDTTFVIHDWGSFIGYQLMWQFPKLMNRTISFDIGTGGHPNVTYQGQNALAWNTEDSAPSMTSARYWAAPCPGCAVWRTAWPYASNVSFRGLLPRPGPPATKPLLFIWGNLTRGKPRGADSLFFGPKWLEFVKSTPHGRVVSGTGDHWIFHENPDLVNGAMVEWLESLGL